MIGEVVRELVRELDTKIVEQNLGDRLVTAAGDETRAEIAAAQMHGDGHIGRDIGNRRVDHVGIDCRQRLGIFAARGDLPAQ